MIAARSMRTLLICSALSGAIVLTSCDGGSGSAPTKSGGSTIRAEAACDMKGAQAPLRRTIILVDAKALTKAGDAVAFAEQNKAFRDLVLSIADPAVALPAGTSAAREQITIAVVPADGSAAQTTFVGCIPGLSAQELADAQSKEGGIGSMFSSGTARQLEDQASNFRTQLIGGMVAAGALAGEKSGSQSGPVAAAPFLAGIRASKGMFDGDDRVQRLVLMSDLSGLDLPNGEQAAVRKAAVEAGRKAAGDLPQVDIHVVLPSGKSAAGREYFESYWLAQGGRLLSYGPEKLGNATPAPIRLWRFSAQAAYPSGNELADVRIGDDGKGKLTASWLTLLGTPSFPIPMTGSISCSGEDCEVRSDRGGFAQAWSDTPGGEPEFRNDLPFGGMRNFSFKIAGERLTGEATDEGVYIGADRGRQGIQITGKAK